MSRRKTNEEFIKECEQIHMNRYSYESVNYVNNKTKVKIICDIHGIFEQTPQCHLKGQGCPYCANRANTHEMFVKKSNKIHNNKFEYYDTYVKNNQKIEIVCPIHGVFKQRPNRHLMGDGCPKCANKTLKHEDFINLANKIHNFKYTYISRYINMKTQILIECPIHGLFEQLPHNHIYQKNGCPVCNASKSELLIKQIFDRENINYEYQKRFKECKNKRTLPFDFYLPDLNTCIEYDGIHHFEEIYSHEDLKYRQKNDTIKTNFCKDNNIKLHRISYKDDTKQKINEILNGKTSIK